MLPAKRTIQPFQVKRLERVVFFPATLVLGSLFWWLWFGSWDAFIAVWPQKLVYQIGLVVVFFLGYALGIVLHEGTHAITWLLVNKQVSRQSIRIGIFPSSGIPYCHLSVPVRRNGYLIGVLMPGLLVGFGPLVVAYVSGSLLAWLWGIFLIHAALKDGVMASYLLKEKPGSWIKDLPEALGYWVYSPEHKPFEGNGTP